MINAKNITIIVILSIDITIIMIDISKIDNAMGTVKMQRFDPHRMLRPLEIFGNALKDQSHAPAYIVEVDTGDRSAAYAAGSAEPGTKDRATTDSTFEIGSQTKMMTAALTLQLADAGRIDLDAKISDYLSANLLHGLANAGRATVREVLAMTSGIPSYTEAVGASGQPIFIEKLLAGEKFGPSDALKVARDMKATGAPGDHYHYSNTNYLLLGLLLEKQTKQSLSSLIEDRIFKPLGMEHSTARPFASDDPRLNSYAVVGEGLDLVDVTHAPWFFKGEAGVVSTTSDMIRFLQGLVSPGGLLSTHALSEMTDFHVVERGKGYVMSFGLGLAKIDFSNGESFVGFTGGTLGTSSSTYISLKTGAVISFAGTASDFASDSGAFALLQALEHNAAWDPGQGNGKGPLYIKDASAADAALLSSHGQPQMEIDGASVALKHSLHDLLTTDSRFADGSIIVVGDNRRGGRDNQANVIDLGRDHPGANGKANHLIGLGGDDRITGGKGDEWLEGDQGRDRLNGGLGNDLIDGGEGRDHLFGGAGRDVFIFRTAAEARGDTIGDFHSRTDKIDFSGIDAIAGGRDDAFHWLGAAKFTGEAGELRYERHGHDVIVSADLDGDRKADFTITLDDIAHVRGSDFLL